MDIKEQQITCDIKTRHPWEKARAIVIKSKLKYFYNKRDEILILDIGCGDVWLSEQLLLSFPNAKFITVDTAFEQEDLDRLRRRLNPDKFSIYLSLESAFKANHEPIDLVLLLDVIEHVENDISFLNTINSFKNISSQTLFLITAPAFQSLFSQNDHFLSHHRRYNNAQLSTVVNLSGFDVKRIGYFFFSLLIPRATMVIKEKMFSRKRTVKGIGGWKKTPFDFLITALLIADYKVSNFLRRLKIKLPGLSNYAICKLTNSN